MIKSVFTPSDVAELKERISKLTPQSTPLWGKMNVGQMLAHANVSYEMAYTNKHPRPNAFLRLMLKMFAKDMVVGPQPYKRSLPTAKAFLMSEQKDFETEKKRLLDFIDYTLQLGKQHFEGKESLSFGKLTSEEWNVMFYKHLDHHLQQFGV
ncbi:DUF1569 domain-containing protein [Mucilaginibacter auburnensis]|uniref:Uncharacterized protein DUF1569 n=1 Tax=Mucilaginibacter auburnensis TaxID=1457233 RepID=A0A2H9VT48_9SPHI|nr:DUF1569 domain-containing protein [Mucilaginibacter auburnensis]PJJ83991.1 uncharacterized protein DUF1569 [Mucilaginibacter auburnensis]